MNILIVYDSEYGNTAGLARVIASELEPLGAVRVESVRTGADIDLDSTDMLVVGGPTQGHGISKPLRAWLNTVPPEAFKGLPVATFDTRLSWPKFLSGSAAEKLAEQAERAGARLIVPPGSFIVSGGQGPLREGELDRIIDWTHGLISSAVEAAT